MKISYAILACTEFQELEVLLKFLKENKKEEDEIVVLLDMSTYTAETENIATKYADLVKYRSLENHFANQKNALIEVCSGDYIFNIDADEIPHENLMNNLNLLLEENPNVDIFYVPRVNTVEGLTENHLQEWHWRLNEKGWVNWPDPQMRIHKNISSIRWKNAVHEILRGQKSFVHLPHEEEWSLYHHKDIKRQEKQNAFYGTL